jgi:ubiquinone/menaquinone biosynthesis C-methylase UbiE
MAVNELIHANDYGLPLNSFLWLETHHQSKADDRIKMIKEMTLPWEGFIVDVGCGPGLWSPLLAQEIGPKGRILGIDISEESLDIANQRSQGAWYEDQVEYRQATLDSPPIELASADIIFSANVSQYLARPVEAFAAMGPYLKPGGRLIVKDIDFGEMHFGGLDPELQKAVFRARKRWENERVQCGYQYEDSWVGSKLKRYMCAAGYSDIVVNKYFIYRNAPLSPEYRTYLQGIAEWFICEEAPYLSLEHREHWRSVFFSLRNCILDRSDFFCREVEYVVSGVWNAQAQSCTNNLLVGHTQDRYSGLSQDSEMLTSFLA